MRENSTSSSVISLQDSLADRTFGHGLTDPADHRLEKVREIPQETDELAAEGAAFDFGHR
jgi:hypothetical protein